MLPKVITPSELRKDLAKFLGEAQEKIFVIKGKKTNTVLLADTEYSRISALAEQFTREDPEGKYRPEFEADILARAKNPKLSQEISSLAEIL